MLRSLVNTNLDLWQGCFSPALYFSFSSVKVDLIFTLSIILCGALSYCRKKPDTQPSTAVPLKNGDGSGFSAVCELCVLEVWAHTPLTAEYRIGSHPTTTVRSH